MNLILPISWKLIDFYGCILKHSKVKFFSESDKISEGFKARKKPKKQPLLIWS